MIKSKSTGIDDPTLVKTKEMGRMDGGDSVQQELAPAPLSVVERYYLVNRKRLAAMASQQFDPIRDRLFLMYLDTLDR